MRFVIRNFIFLCKCLKNYTNSSIQGYEIYKLMKCDQLYQKLSRIRHIKHQLVYLLLCYHSKTCKIPSNLWLLTAFSYIVAEQHNSVCNLITDNISSCFEYLFQLLLQIISNFTKFISQIIILPCSYC